MTVDAMPASPERPLFDSDHEQFRDTVHRFIEREITPHHDAWEEQGYVDRSAWLAAGAAGLLCVTMPEQYGGAGVDRRYSTVLIEEFARAAASGPGFSLHSEIVANYLLRYANEEQKQRWLPPMARGEKISAIAMTEPGAGSDLQSIRTTALRDGDHYIVNGSKTYITNGYNSDIVIVVAKTDPGKGAKGTSLIVVEEGMAGFSKGKRLNKIGLKAQDTSELFFEDVRVPAENLLGERGRGFANFLRTLDEGRIAVAALSTGAAQGCLDESIRYAKERVVFGQPIADYQHIEFMLARMKARVHTSRLAWHDAARRCDAGLDFKSEAAIAKLVASDAAMKNARDATQIFGGYGFMNEYLVARHYRDSKILEIGEGTNEVQLMIIARALGLDH